MTAQKKSPGRPRKQKLIPGKQIEAAKAETPEPEPKDVAATPTTLEVAIRDLARQIEDIKLDGVVDMKKSQEEVEGIKLGTPETPVQEGATYRDLFVSWINPNGDKVEINAEGSFNPREFNTMVNNIPKVIGKRMAPEVRAQRQGRTRKTIIRDFKAREADRQQKLLRLNDKLGKLRSAQLSDK